MQVEFSSVHINTLITLKFYRAGSQREVCETLDKHFKARTIQGTQKTGQLRNNGSKQTTTNERHGELINFWKSRT